MPFLGKTPTKLLDANVNIDGGNIDGTTIGATSAASATVTTFTSTGIDDNATATRLTVSNGFTEFNATNHYVKFNGITDSTDIGTSSSNSGYSYFVNNSPTAGTGNNGFALYDSGAVEIWASADNAITGSLRIDASGNTTVNGFTSTGIDDNATSTAVTIDSSQNVGIGTTSPAEVLHIANTGTAGAIGLRAENSEGHVNFTTNGGGFQFETGASGTVAVIDSSGNVGIGTTGPDSNLHISSTTAPILRFERNDTTIATGNGIGQIQFEHQETGYEGVCATLRVESGNNNGNGEFVFQNGVAGTLTEKMRIDRNGNVGIGGSPVSSTRRLMVTDTGDVRVDIRSGSDTNLGAIDFSDTSNTARGQIIYDHNTDSMAFETLSTERMRIDSSGNLGIGTTNPVTFLSVNAGSSPDAQYGVANFAAGSGVNSYVTVSRGGNDQGGIKILRGSVPDLSIYVNSAESSIINYNGGDTNDGLFFQRGSAATNVMALDNSGNVGIGTTSPAGPLHIQSATNRTLILDGTYPTGSFTWQSIRRSGTEKWRWFLENDDDVTLYADVNSTGSVMRWGSDGKVAIGFTTPEKELEINLSSTTTTTLGQKGGLQLRAESSTVGNGGEITWASGSGNTERWCAISGHITTNSATGSVGELVFATKTTQAATTPTEAMRITKDANVVMGKTAIGFTTTGLEFRGGGDGRLYVTSDADACSVFRRNTSSGIISYFYRGSTNVGDISVTTTATSYNTTSDERLKENIVDALAGNIDAIRVRSFDWKANGAHQPHGMIAQELVDVAPEAVTQGETENDMWTVDYSKLVPMMIKEIQDLRARVAQLEGA